MGGEMIATKIEQLIWKMIRQMITRAVKKIDKILKKMSDEMTDIRIEQLNLSLTMRAVKKMVDQLELETKAADL